MDKKKCMNERIKSVELFRCMYQSKMLKFTQIGFPGQINIGTQEEKDPAEPKTLLKEKAV